MGEEYSEKMKNKVLIIGGNGFIGKNLVQAFKKKNYKITILDNKQNRNNKIEFIKGDILNLNQLKKNFKNFDYVFNFAGYSDLNKSRYDPIKTVNQNILGTVNCLEACKHNKIKRFFYASSLYSDTNIGNFYRCSKKAAEDYTLEYNKRFGLNYTIIKFGSIYGSGSDQSNTLYKIIHDAFKSKKLTYHGTKDTMREYIHVEDAAEATIDLMSKNYNNKTVNITSGKLLKVETVLKMINEIINKKYEIKFLTKKNIAGHYVTTPYRLSENITINYTKNNYIDLGNGLKNLIEFVLTDKSK